MLSKLCLFVHPGLLGLDGAFVDQCVDRMRVLWVLRMAKQGASHGVAVLGRKKLLFRLVFVDIVRCMRCGHVTGETSIILLGLLARGLVGRAEELRGDSTLLVMVFNAPDAPGI